LIAGLSSGLVLAIIAAGLGSNLGALLLLLIGGTIGFALVVYAIITMTLRDLILHVSILASVPVRPNLGTAIRA
jgi:hypothetical protein